MLAFASNAHALLALCVAPPAVITRPERVGVAGYCRRGDVDVPEVVFCGRIVPEDARRPVGRACGPMGVGRDSRHLRHVVCAAILLVSGEAAEPPASQPRQRSEDGHPLLGDQRAILYHARTATALACA